MNEIHEFDTPRVQTEQQPVMLADALSINISQRLEAFDSGEGGVLARGQAAGHAEAGAGRGLRQPGQDVFESAREFRQADGLFGLRQILGIKQLVFSPIEVGTGRGRGWRLAQALDLIMGCFQFTAE